MIRAMTNKIWTNPPIVYEVTNPSAHMTKRITNIVQSMFHLISGWMLLLSAYSDSRVVGEVVLFQEVKEDNGGIKSVDQ